MDEFDDVSFEVEENLSFQDESFSELDDFDGEIEEVSDVSELDEMLGISDGSFELDEFDGEIDEVGDVAELDEMLGIESSHDQELADMFEDSDDSDEGYQYVKKYPY